MKFLVLSSLKKPKTSTYTTKSNRLMSTLAEKLRIACEANGLGVSGSSSVLLARLVKGGNNEKKRPKGKKTTTSSPKKKMVCKNGVC